MRRIRQVNLFILSGFKHKKYQIAFFWGKLSLYRLFKSRHTDDNTQSYSLVSLVTYPNAVVPRLSFWLHRLDSKSMAHRSTTQTVATLHLVRYDPHLHPNNKNKTTQSSTKKHSRSFFKNIYILVSGIYPGTDLVQRPYGDLAYIIRDVFPGGALRVPGGLTLPVPQVTWTGNSHIRHMIRICLPR